jgi:hypothetical protein
VLRGHEDREYLGLAVIVGFFTFFLSPTRTEFEIHNIQIHSMNIWKKHEKLLKIQNGVFI